MTSLALLFTLSAIGISETIYLIRKRLAAENPYCVIGRGCTQVLESDWSRVFIIPTDMLGLFFYSTATSVSAYLSVGIWPLPLIEIIFEYFIGIGAIVSIFFTYLQWRVIRAWCFWCLMSASTIWLMGIIIILRNLF